MGKVIGEQEEIWLSIVVPVYNAESYLCRCVDSILAQTFKEFELILVDDGSVIVPGRYVTNMPKKTDV